MTQELRLLCRDEVALIEPGSTIQMGIGGIRVSTHFFNTEQDIDFLLSTQKKILS